MDDKTMLELAARAAGVEFDGYDERENCLLKNHQTSYGPGKSFWNPLTDDGDALRLAVKLRLRVSAEDFEAFAGPFDWHMSLCEEYGSDPYAATRRAIVRAAAEIGKAMGRG